MPSILRYKIAIENGERTVHGVTDLTFLTHNALTAHTGTYFKSYCTHTTLYGLYDLTNRSIVRIFRTQYGILTVYVV